MKWHLQRTFPFCMLYRILNPPCVDTDTLFSEVNFDALWSYKEVFKHIIKEKDLMLKVSLLAQLHGVALLHTSDPAQTYYCSVISSLISWHYYLVSIKVQSDIQILSIPVRVTKLLESLYTLCSKILELFIRTLEH